jgi:GT2 family glycosyltransferase
VGCGFALRSDVYFMTDGFPTRVDIYGEESCLSLEIISKGFKILWTNSIMVHHRVNKNVRANSGRNHFRFTKQLRNVSLFYVVYYKNPYAKLFKLYFHNFKKYAVKDIQYFKGFFSAMGRFIVSVPSVLKYRSPIDKKYIEQRNKLKNPGF